MNNMTTVTPAADDAHAHEALVDRYVDEMKRLQEQMANEREEILTIQA